MKHPTIEEVREYFKDALEVKSASSASDKVGVINNNTEFKKIDSSIYIGNMNSFTCVYSSLSGYAEITKYKPKKDFKTITESITELLEYKNKKYGKSALNSIEIFNGKTKVGQRLDDKISRVKNSDVLRKNDIADIIGYLILVCQENDWNNFDEFKD